MAGRQIFELDIGTRNRTNVLAQQDSAGANDATQISADELLKNLLLTDIPQSGATNNQALIWNGTQWAPGDVATDTANLNGNPVINPSFSIVQRQVNPTTLTTYNDGAYSADRWVSLFQDANGQFGQITGVGQRYAGQFKKTASGTTRLGTVQWIENVNCYHLRNTEVTLQLRVRCSEASKTIRCGLIESTKSADSLTRDPISDWSTTPVSLLTDYTFSGTPGSVVSDTNWQTLSYTTTLGNTFNNLGVLVWTETGLSQDATLDIEAVCVSISGATIVFVPRSISEELLLCYRYFEIIRNEVASQFFFLCGHRSAALSIGVANFTKKRAIPNITNNTASNFAIYVFSSGATRVLTNLTWTLNSSSSARFGGATSGLTAGESGCLFTNGAGPAEIYIDAEL